MKTRICKGAREREKSLKNPKQKQREEETNKKV
jgi:hypothetical protein